MSQLSEEDFQKYAHSPAHFAVARCDYDLLRGVLSRLPRLPTSGEVTTEMESVLAEQKAEVVSSVIDCRDVPGRETPLHLAVRLGNTQAVEMLMAAGADCSLQNARGWSALQEAVVAGKEAIAMIITKYYQPNAWAKWCRRLPRIVAEVNRMKDFYMELTFHFESSVIPFVGRIAPSDTYKIWKRGGNLRADMTLSGFDSFRVQRSDRSYIFLTKENTDLGELLVLTHKKKEVMSAFVGAGVQPTDTEIAQEVAEMSRSRVYRPGIDVTEAAIVPQLTWRKHEKVEMVGSWKCKVYDMRNVQLSIRSRRVSGAVEEDEDEEDDDVVEYDPLVTLSDKEQLQLQMALKAANDEQAAQEMKANGKNKKKPEESEFTKGLRPTIWVTENFPLKIEELLPLLDILSSKVKAVRRVRELLTTKLPSGTFPVKIAIPVFPTVRVIVTFTKFHELHRNSGEQQASKHEQTAGWFSWMRGSHNSEQSDPFVIPSDYTWKKTVT